MLEFPPIPQEVKPVAHLMKLAGEYDERNIVISYWARMAACHLALKIVPGEKSQATSELLGALLDWLEAAKELNCENEGVTNEATAQALIEEYAVILYNYGVKLDASATFNKITVKTFYMTCIMIDILDQFGPISNSLRERRKYANWKAINIHHCLKHGDIPSPGPPISCTNIMDANHPSGIVHNSLIPPEQLATYKKYTGPIDFSTLKAVWPLPPPIVPPQQLIPFNPPKQLDDSNIFNDITVSSSHPVHPPHPVQYINQAATSVSPSDCKQSLLPVLVHTDGGFVQSNITTFSDTSALSPVLEATDEQFLQVKTQFPNNPHALITHCDFSHTLSPIFMSTDDGFVQSNTTPFFDQASASVLTTDGGLVLTTEQTQLVPQYYEPTTSDLKNYDLKMDTDQLQ